MLNTLKDLRDNYGVMAVKAEFEAEGSRTDELVMLNEIVFRADMKTYIKIGGCEAVRDLDQCRLLGASGIMAPMIESPFAMTKFEGAIKKVYTKEEQESIEFIINAETKTFCENSDDIFKIGKDFLKVVVVGRVDLSASYGLGRSGIDSEMIFLKTRDICLKAREYGYIAGMGGGITFEDVSNIDKLKGIIDRFETRKIIFDMARIGKDIRNGIIKAIEFELLYLKNKAEFYDRMANEENKRIVMLEERLKAAKEA